MSFNPINRLVCGLTYLGRSPSKTSAAVSRHKTADNLSCNGLVGVARDVALHNNIKHALPVLSIDIHIYNLKPVIVFITFFVRVLIDSKLLEEISTDSNIIKSTTEQTITSSETCAGVTN